MSLRRKARELVLQSLYQSELNGKPLSETFRLLREHFEIDKKALPYAAELIEGMGENHADLDQRISKQTKNWRMERMSLIDRNIIRIGAYELCFRPEIPAEVVINEALEVARRYSTDEAAPFINGILDGIAKGVKLPPDA
ncbi:MAG: transcription antitermination factor NusB [Desulfobulbaceae bacterium]|nr:transcription antitermination factor NusB [Desulfobulbaceae bacterium]